MQNMDKNCRVCMEWQEHCYWSHMADEEKHFFKPMLGDFAESMSIPARFAKNFNGHISEVISLKSPSGKTWSIGAATDTDELVLRSGWKEFVGAHGVEEGDCLLFRYTGESSFNVLVFDAGGCEKTSPRFAGSHGCERIESPAGVDAGSKRLVIRGSCGPSRSKGGNGDCTPQQDDGGARLEQLALGKNAGSSRSVPRSSCKRSLCRDIEEAEWCEVKEDVELLEDDGGGDGEAPAKKSGYFFCKNGPVSGYHLSEEEREEISRVRVPAAQPGNPVFVQVMHPSHVRGHKPGVVAISSEFAAKYLGSSRRDVVLERGGGKGRWQVRYNCNRFCRGLTGRGWCGFVADNGLRDHDVCLFELLRGKGAPRRPTMAVHVLRKLRGSFVLLR